MKTNNLLILLSLFTLAVLFLGGCKKEDNSDESTTVEIFVNDETGTIHGDFIKSIYDPNNDQDFRYSKYDATKSVKFTNVELGNYRVHAFPAQPNNGNWTDITVNKGDHYTITFTYFIDGYVAILGVVAPHYWWKNNVVRN